MPLKWAADINRAELAETTSDQFEFRYIDIGSVDSSGGVDVPLESISFATAPSRARRLAPRGATVVSTVRTYLRAIARVPEDGLVFSTGFATLEAGPQVDPRFLYYACRSDSFVEKVVARSTGVSYPAINPSDLGMIHVCLPRHEEQRRIADFLDDQVSRIDQTIALRMEQRNRLDERRRSVADLALTSVSDGEVIPLRRLVSDVCVGIVIQPAALYVLDDSSGVAALRGTDIREGWIDTSAPVRLSVQGHRANPRSQLRLGDVVVVRTGVAGTAAVITAETTGWNCIDLVIVRTGPRLIPEFLELVLNHFASQAKIGAAASGSIQAHFGVGAVRDLEIPHASMSDQQRLVPAIAGARADISRARTAMEDQIRLLTERKRALITAAVTGEFDVTTASGRGVA